MTPSWIPVDVIVAVMVAGWLRLLIGSWCDRGGR